MRKDFTESERVSICEAVEEEIGKRQGKRTDLEEENQLVEPVPQVLPGGKTRDLAAQKVGWSRKTFEEAKKVVKDGTEELVQTL